MSPDMNHPWKLWTIFPIDLAINTGSTTSTCSLYILTNNLLSEWKRTSMDTQKRMKTFHMCRVTWCGLWHGRVAVYSIVNTRLHSILQQSPQRSAPHLAQRCHADVACRNWPPCAFHAGLVRFCVLCGCRSLWNGAETVLKRC